MISQDGLSVNFQETLRTEHVMIIPRSYTGGVTGGPFGLDGKQISSADACDMLENR